MQSETKNDGVENVRDLSPEEAHIVFKTHLMNYGLSPFKDVDTRTFRVIESLGLTDAEPQEILGKGTPLDVLAEEEHPNREPLPPGPYLVYGYKEKPPRRILNEVPSYLLSEIRGLREAAVVYLERLTRCNPPVVTPKTIAILAEKKQDIVGADEVAWRKAGVAVYDAFTDDLLVALAALRQGMATQPPMEFVLNENAPRVLRPTVSSLESIALPVINPEADPQMVAKLLGNIVKKGKTVHGLCDAYLDKLGYLPFAHPFSLGQALEEWIKVHTTEELLQELWAWCSDNPGPVSRYHVCTALASHPEWIPEDKLAEFWNEAVSLLSDGERDDLKGAFSERWRLRRELARHYIHHLESEMPGHEGARIASLSWWLAERVAQLFPDDEESAKFYNENWVKPATEISSRVWLTAYPPIIGSRLRGATLALSSPWSYPLLCALSKSISKLQLTAQSDVIKEKLHRGVGPLVLLSIPFPDETPEDVVFMFESAPGDFIRAVAETGTEEQKKSLEELIKINHELNTSEKLCSELRTLNDSIKSIQIAVLLALKGRALTDSSLAEPVWEIISDKEWKKKVMSAVDDDILDLLVRIITSLQVGKDGKWRTELPHYLAELCEQAETDKRRQALFIYVIQSCLASETVSALQRLLRGDKRFKFADYAKSYRQHIESMWPNYPGWVQGKLRGLLANLHVA